MLAISDEQHNHLLVSARTLEEGQQHKSLVALGVTGHGKSTFLNYICNANRFQTSSGLFGLRSCTKKTDSELLAMADKPLLLIDTPGLLDTSRIEEAAQRDSTTTEWHSAVQDEGEQLLQELKRAFLIAGERINAFLLVYNISQRWSMEMSSACGLLDKILSWDHTILVVTHGTVVSREPKEWQTKFREFVASTSCPEQLRLIVERVEKRVLIVDSTSKMEENRVSATIEILKMVDGIDSSKEACLNACFLQAERNFLALKLKQIEELESNSKFTALVHRVAPLYQSLTELGKAMISSHSTLISSLQELADTLDTIQGPTPKFQKQLTEAVGGTATAGVGVGLIAVGIIVAPLTFGAVAAAGVVVATAGCAIGTPPIISILKDNAKAMTAQKWLENDLQSSQRFYNKLMEMEKEANCVFQNSSDTLTESALVTLAFQYGHTLNSSINMQLLTKAFMKVKYFQKLRQDAKEVSQVQTAMGGPSQLHIGFQMFESSRNVREVAAKMAAINPGERARQGNFFRQSCIDTLIAERKFVAQLCNIDLC